MERQLILDLSSAETGARTQTGELELVVLDSGGAEETQSLRVHCELDVQARRVHVHARVTGEAGSHCHRCLNEFARPIETEFDVILQRGGESPGDEVVALTETSVEYDLTPHVREAVILEEPIQLLCRPDCKGLCSQCGRDLNTGSCSCAPSADARWEALKKLVEPPGSGS